MLFEHLVHMKHILLVLQQLTTIVWSSMFYFSALSLMFCGSDLPSGTQMLQNDVTVHSLCHIRI